MTMQYRAGTYRKETLNAMRARHVRPRHTSFRYCGTEYLKWRVSFIQKLGGGFRLRSHTGEGAIGDQVRCILNKKYNYGWLEFELRKSAYVMIDKGIFYHQRLILPYW